MKKYTSLKSIKRQKGFTLIELIIVVVILGILGYVAMSVTSGSPDPANATAMRSAAKELSKGIGYLHANLGNGLSATSNALPASGLNMMDVMMVGRDAVASSYQASYDRANMRPLESDFSITQRPTGTASGQYQLLTYPVTFVSAGCATGRVCVQFGRVPTSTLQELVAKYGINNFDATAALSTGPVRYTAADSHNFHTVTIENVP